MRKNLKWIVLLTVLCIPLLWLGVKDSHDWGDDFASYLHQAQNICEGKPQSEIGYLYNPHYAILGPRAYTVGFPLLLSPIYALFGHNIYVYLLVMSVILIVFLLMMFAFLSLRMKPFYAFLFCMMIAYNPGTLYLKCEIMCDISIAFFLLLTIFFYERWKNVTPIYYSILLALMNGFLLSIKGTGIVITAGLFISLFFTLIKEGRNLNRVLLKNTLIMIVGGLLFYSLLNEIIFPTPRGGISHFSSLTIGEDYLDLFKINLDNYLTQFNLFFTPEVNEWKAIPKLTASVMLSFTICGFLLKVKKKTELADIVFVLYILLILFYPYQAGIRFIFPLLSFACYYIYLTAQQLSVNFKHKQLIAVSITIVMLLQYKTILEKIIETKGMVQDGPQRVAAQEAFQFIQNNTAKSAVFDFRRPRALALYTNRKACTSFPWDTPQQVLQNIDSLQVNYCMINKGDRNPALDSLIQIKPELFKEVWNNEVFFIYKFR